MKQPCKRANELPPIYTLWVKSAKEITVQSHVNEKGNHLHIKRSPAISCNQNVEFALRIRALSIMIDDDSSRAGNTSLYGFPTTIRKLEVGAEQYAPTAPDIPRLRLAQFLFLLECHKRGFVQGFFI